MENNNIFAPPTEDELNAVFAPPTEEELKVSEPAPIGKLQSALAGAKDAATLGFSDEIQGGVGAAKDFLGNAELTAMDPLAVLGMSPEEQALSQQRQQGKSKISSMEDLVNSYKQSRDAAREDLKNKQAANPGSFLGGQLLGGAALAPVTLGGAPLTLARTAGIGAGIGGLSGLGSSEAEDVPTMLKDVGIGAGIGAGTGAIASGISSGVKSIAGSESGKKLGEIYKRALTSKETRLGNPEVRNKIILDQLDKTKEIVDKFPIKRAQLNELRSAVLSDKKTDNIAPLLKEAREKLAQFKPAGEEEQKSIQSLLSTIDDRLGAMDEVIPQERVVKSVSANLQKQADVLNTKFAKIAELKQQGKTSEQILKQIDDPDVRDFIKLNSEMSPDQLVEGLSKGRVSVETMPSPDTGMPVGFLVQRSPNAPTKVIKSVPLEDKVVSEMVPTGKKLMPDNKQMNLEDIQQTIERFRELGKKSPDQVQRQTTDLVSNLQKVQDQINPDFRRINQDLYDTGIVSKQVLGTDVTALPTQGGKVKFDTDEGKSALLNMFKNISKSTDDPIAKQNLEKTLGGGQVEELFTPTGKVTRQLPGLADLPRPMQGPANTKDLLDKTDSIAKELDLVKQFQRIEDDSSLRNIGLSNLSNPMATASDAIVGTTKAGNIIPKAVDAAGALKRNIKETTASVTDKITPKFLKEMLSGPRNARSEALEQVVNTQNKQKRDALIFNLMQQPAFRLKADEINSEDNQDGQ